MRALQLPGAAAALLFLLVSLPSPPAPGADSTAPPGAFGIPVHGPYHAEFIAGGASLIKPLPGYKTDAALAPGTPFTLSGWVQTQECPGHRCLLFGLGTAGADGAYIGLQDGSPAFWVAGGKTVAASAPLVIPLAAPSGTAPAASPWHFLAASFDGGTVRLYADGAEVASGAVQTQAIRPVLQLAPRKLLGPGDLPFAGRLAEVRVTAQALDASAVRAAARQPPAFELLNYEAGSPGWPVQTRQMVGQAAPQDAWTLPASRAPFSRPVAEPVAAGEPLKSLGEDIYEVGGWQLRAAPEVSVPPERIASPGLAATGWYAAVVPGTVLTTLVARGVYPDPDYGLNNLAIPEALNKQDWWYRTTFTAPQLAPGQRAHLVFNGINYAADIWVNGQRAGTVRGAFARAQLDVTDRMKKGEPVTVAVRVSPPPDPGIPHEQSISAGPGNNGGMMALDGPTFIAAEGWDWIPAVRDRNTGLWQDVQLQITGAIQIGDLQVITTLPDPRRTDLAEVTIEVPLTSRLDRPVEAQLHAAFDDVTLTKTVTVAPGTRRVVLSPAEFPALRVAHPRLWWPNGYGAPALHTLTTSVAVGGAGSDHRVTRFGMRQITYELSLLDDTGHLRRVEIDPAAARALGTRLVDVRHPSIRRLTAERFGTWAPTFFPGAGKSPAVHPLADDPLAPNMVIRVNGVRIAARGGNWGMDDWRKRVSREHLEPYFRLHRDAHLNIIRNWLGQSTEETFFALADEYGMLVINEFWASTQNFQLEPQDVPLFLDNAAEVIRRFRNHPSIVFWNGRNEGVPQPPLNEGLSRLVDSEDGTRYYSPASLAINLALGGPYAYRPCVFYFDYWGNGFTMELGIPSFPTLEAFQRFTPPQDQWPIGDTWAYHDWHADGNGDTRPFMTALTARYGAPADLKDFERKAQLMNYDAHRAAFEGFNAGLWTRNSGRLLWMSQPAWPSTVWQILSSDYDTHAAYYGVKAAAEAVHVQLDLPGWNTTAVNNTQAPLRQVRLQATIHRLDGTVIQRLAASLDVEAGAVASGPVIPLKALLEKERAVLVLLTLTDAQGRELSRNLYWETQDDADGSRLAGMPAQPVSLTLSSDTGGAESHLLVAVRNDGNAPALAIKLTLEKSDGTRILPAYYSDNYVSLLPHERRLIDIRFPKEAHGRCTVRGWNVKAGSVAF